MAIQVQGVRRGVVQQRLDGAQMPLRRGQVQRRRAVGVGLQGVESWEATDQNLEQLGAAVHRGDGHDAGLAARQFGGRIGPVVEQQERHVHVPILCRGQQRRRAVRFRDIDVSLRVDQHLGNADVPILRGSVERSGLSGAAAVRRSAHFVDQVRRRLHPIELARKQQRRGAGVVRDVRVRTALVQELDHVQVALLRRRHQRGEVVLPGLLVHVRVRLLAQQLDDGQEAAVAGDVQQMQAGGLRSQAGVCAGQDQRARSLDAAPLARHEQRGVAARGHRVELRAGGQQCVHRRELGAPQLLDVAQLEDLVLRQRHVR